LGRGSPGGGEALPRVSGKESEFDGDVYRENLELKKEKKLVGGNEWMCLLKEMGWGLSWLGGLGKNLRALKDVGS